MTTTPEILLYCRRCDLAFCKKHVAAHIWDEGHMLHFEPSAKFCSVCAGIYEPPEDDAQTKR